MSDTPVDLQKTLIALKDASTVNLTLNWYPSDSLSPPRAYCAVEPLINGEAAFGAVADAIENATLSVDIISWGFDPSMRLKRPDGLLLGDLLEAAGKKGCKVRVLIWKNALANVMENTLVGDGLGGSGGTDLGSGMGGGVSSLFPNTTIPQLERERNYWQKDLEYWQAKANSQATSVKIPEGIQRIISLNPRKNAEIVTEIASCEAHLSRIERIILERQKELQTVREGSAEYGKQAQLKKQRTELYAITVNLQNTINALETSMINGNRESPSLLRSKQSQLVRYEREAEVITQKLSELENAGYASGKTGSGQTANDPSVEKYTRDWFSRVKNGDIKNVELRTRDFSNPAPPLLTANLLAPGLSFSDRGKIWRQLDKEDPQAGWTMLRLLTFFASHHQKSVMVDYQLAHKVQGFVMGHNFHRNYWDTNSHSYDQPLQDVGFKPWQDISSQIKGPVLYDLNRNFVQAWDKGTSLYEKLFGEGALATERDGIKPPFFMPKASEKAQQKDRAQILRTQPQDGESSIKTAYENALSKVRNNAYIENQYFRYHQFATLLKDMAIKRKEAGAPRDMHLFVVTNNPNSGHFSSSTYAMMSELGQQQLMPQVYRDGKEELKVLIDEQTRLEQKQIDTQALINKTSRRRRQSHQMAAMRTKTNLIKNQQAISELNERYQISEADLEDLKTANVESFEEINRMEGLHEKQSDLAKDGKPLTSRDQQALNQLEAKHGYDDIKPEIIEAAEGLKVVIATLVSHKIIGKDDKGKDTCQYKDIYIHSKLLLVDDVYFTLGSANINKRSMESDSELNVGGAIPSTTRKFKNDLWQMHTNKAPENLDKIKKDYNFWTDVAEDNWKFRKQRKPLTCTLTRFWDTQTPWAIALD